jgi:hypothetical protein
MGSIPSPLAPDGSALSLLTANVTAIETNYTGAGGAEATVGAGLVAAEADILATAVELGDYTGGGGAETDVATGLVQAETDIGALETELGDYTGGGGAEASVAAGLVQAEADVLALQADVGTDDSNGDLFSRAPVVVSKAFDHTDVAALGAVADGYIDFAAALPAGAVVIGAGCNVTAVFDNAGDTADVALDIGIKSGDADAFVDGASLDAVAKVGSPAGAGLGTLVGAVTPSLFVNPTVNCDTITKGGAVAYLIYVLAF